MDELRKVALENIDTAIRALENLGYELDGSIDEDTHMEIYEIQKAARQFKRNHAELFAE